MTAYWENKRNKEERIIKKCPTCSSIKIYTYKGFTRCTNCGYEHKEII